LNHFLGIPKLVPNPPKNNKRQKTMSAASATQLTFPVLCIPRAMSFHTAEMVEEVINEAMHGKFVKTVNQSTTTDKAGIQFNVFFIHPDQDFKANRSTDLLYKNLRTENNVNISLGNGSKYFWKVKLYVPHLKAQYLPPTEQHTVVKPVEAVKPPVAPFQFPPLPTPVGPRVMSVEEAQEFEEWRREKAAAKKAAEEAKKAAEEKAAIRQKNGERLFPLVTAILSKEYPQFQHAGKVTGMILDLSQEEIEQLIKEPEQLISMVHEGVRVYREHLLREAGAA
jgi:hypothetical protein